MQDVGFKVITIIALFLLTLLAGLLPMKIRGSHTTTRQRVLSLCNCFAGGVFFATCLLDLLPMVREKYKEVFPQKNIHTDFPVAEFTTCVGFFLVLIGEQIAHQFHDSSLLHGHSPDSRQPLLKGHRQSHESFNPANSDSNSISVHCHQVQDASVRVYILVLALSLHSVFEGLALGLITNKEHLAEIAVAIVIHKSTIAFSLGVNLAQHKVPTRTIIISAFLFSIMSPIGAGIGIAVLDSSSQLSSGLASGILQGIANGTFLFITFFEIFQRELESKGNRLLKVLFMLTGFSVVTILVYFSGVLDPEE